MKRSLPHPRIQIKLLFLLVFLVVVFTVTIRLLIPKEELRTIQNYKPWSSEVIKLAQTLPIQDGGRIKPFSTYAGFTMLSMNGKRSLEFQDQKGTVYKITPTEWLLDTLFRMPYALKMPHFQINNAAVMEAIGGTIRGKRDRYSFEDLFPVRQKLIELGQSYEKIPSKQRDAVQQQVLDLSAHYLKYEELILYSNFAQFGKLFDLEDKSHQGLSLLKMSALLQMAPQLRQDIARFQNNHQDIPKHLEILQQKIMEAVSYSQRGLAILPPDDVKDNQWRTIGNGIVEIFSDQSSSTDSWIGFIKHYESMMEASKVGQAAFLKAIKAYHDDFVAKAEQRGEYSQIIRENKYYQQNGFTHSLIFYLTGALFVFGMWLARGKWYYRFGFMAAMMTGLGMIVGIVAIVQRCLIMGRPPVGNLYDTIIFIGTTAVLITFLIELLSRKGYALVAAPFIGAMLMLLANRYELGDAKDHMDPLVAVLRSNYWLTTHVITITLGYSAGLLASFLSCFYVLARGFKLMDAQSDLRMFLTRSVYGMIGFTCLLSLTGTVLGGIWANDSWGRFWGWDPKENGALMIVIWNLVILHARMGGIIKEWGLHLASVFMACIVVFSWWHVNFLGVGLHNYGFTAGKDAIWLFYIILGLILFYGFTVRFLEQQKKHSEIK